MIIPTRLKSRLPGHLSYPIGAQAISNALAGLPRVEAFTITFYDQVVWPASESARILRDQLPYHLMEVRFTPRTKPNYGGARALIEAGYYDEKWDLQVNPVLRELRHMANELLRNHGLPMVAEWLQSSGKVGWTTRVQRCALLFDPQTETLEKREKTGA
jgi:hypothetical protein